MARSSSDNFMKNASTATSGRSHPDPGLCGACRHSRPMNSDRGSTFFLCELSLQDPSFPKYPRLPVLVCPGYQARQV